MAGYGIANNTRVSSYSDASPRLLGEEETT